MYRDCLAKGYLRDVTRVSALKPKTLLENATTSANAARILAAQLPTDAKEWMNVFILGYDALHLCAEALLHLVQAGSDNHCCLFAALVVNYPRLDLDWAFLERLRIKRNAIQYKGESMTHHEWLSIEPWLTRCLRTLQQEIGRPVQP